MYCRTFVWREQPLLLRWKQISFICTGLLQNSTDEKNEMGLLLYFRFATAPFVCGKSLPEFFCATVIAVNW